MIDHPGVPLFSLQKGMTADVGIHCRECARYQVAPLDAVIRRLNAKGLDGARVGVRELAQQLTKPCDRCGSRNRETRPAFHPQPGAAVSMGVK